MCNNTSKRHNEFSPLKTEFTLCKNIFTFKNIGKRKIQEDDIFICDIVDIDKNLFNMVFIFDGHGAKDNVVPLPQYIIKNNVLYKELSSYFKIRKLTSKNIGDFFLTFDSFLENKIEKYIGTCLSAVIISLEHVYVVTLGDTNVQIFDNNGNLFYKTPIHDFNNKKELSRFIENKQDHLIKNSRYKGLLMSRTLGDFDCKTIGERCLTGIPEIKKFFNNRNFVFLLKTDGINTSSKILLKKYNEGNIKEFMDNKKFIDNASLIIFENNYEKSIKTIKQEDNLDSSINNLLSEFLEYVHR